ncbi:hypothetical protein D3C79_1027090 [compost metagenome]
MKQHFFTQEEGPLCTSGVHLPSVRQSRQNLAAFVRPAGQTIKDVAGYEGLGKPVQVQRVQRIKLLANRQTQRVDLLLITAHLRVVPKII